MNAATTSAREMDGRLDSEAFANFFAREIAPRLAPLEKARQARLTGIYVRAFGAAIITAFATAIIAFMRAPIPAIMVVLAVTTLIVFLASETLLKVAPAAKPRQGVHRLLPQHPLLRAFTLTTATVAAVLILWLLVWLMSGNSRSQILHFQTAFFVALAGTVLGYFWVRAVLQRHDANLQSLVMPPLCHFLGAVKHIGMPGDLFDARRFEEYGIVQPFSSPHLYDLLIGRHRETDFRAATARLTKSGDDAGLSFEGLLCEISVPVPFSCRVLITFGFGAAGKLGEGFNAIQDYWRSTVSDFWPVETKNPAFDERYRAYSDDPEAAEKLLSRGFMDALLDVSAELSRLPVRCVFAEGQLLIALPVDLSLFEFGSLHRSLRHAESDLHRIATAFTIPHRLIDNLHGDSSPLLPDGDN